MRAACNCKTETTLYYGKIYRIGWYVIAFHYRESFQGLVASQSIIFFFASCYTLSPLQDYKYNLCNVKWSRYRPGVAQWVGRGIALLFHDRGTRRGWAVSSTPRPPFTPGKDPVPILQEAGWASGPVWTVGKSHSHWDSIPDRATRSQSLYRLSYRTQKYVGYIYIYIK